MDLQVVGDQTLEWLKLLGAARRRERAEDLLSLMRVINVAQGASKDEWAKTRDDLIQQTEIS